MIEKVVNPPRRREGMEKGKWHWVECSECGGKGSYLQEGGFNDCGSCVGYGRFFRKIKVVVRKDVPENMMYLINQNYLRQY